MLVGKFLSKNRLQPIEGKSIGNTELLQKEMKLEAIVTKEFDRFIDKQTFTQKNLFVFEIDLKNKIDDILRNEGIHLVGEFKNPKLMNTKTLEQKNLEPHNAYGSLTSRPRNGKNLNTNISLPQLDRRAMGVKSIDTHKSGYYRNSLANIHRDGAKTTNQQSVAKYNRNFKGSEVRQSLGTVPHNQSLLQKIETKRGGKSQAVIESVRQQNKSAAIYQQMDTMASPRVGNESSQQSPSRLLGKPFADIRVKLGNKKSPNRYEQDAESEPSNISDDMWGEIPKYNHMKYQEQLRKEKEQFLQKRQIVKKTLDQQIQEQQEEKRRQFEYMKAIDQQMLDKARNELEREKKKREEVIAKTFQAKEQRDQMLMEAQRQKEEHYQKLRRLELEEVDKLKQAIEKEKNDKLEKKKKERQAAWKVIAENEVEKAKRLKEKEDDKKHQVELIKEYNRMLEAQDKKRADEWAKREERIKNAMGRMADTVIKKNNDAERELERRVLQYANEKDQRAKAEEDAKKEARRKRDQDIKKTLDAQMEEKRKRRHDEMEDNKKFVKMVIDSDETYNREQREKEQRTFKKLQELQRFQRIQMGELPVDENAQGSVDASSITKRRKRQAVGGPMNLEEQRMNKNILKEISQMKRNLTHRANSNSVEMEHGL